MATAPTTGTRAGGGEGWECAGTLGFSRRPWQVGWKKGAGRILFLRGGGADRGVQPAGSETRRDQMKMGYKPKIQLGWDYLAQRLKMKAPAKKPLRNAVGPF